MFTKKFLALFSFLLIILTTFLSKDIYALDAPNFPDLENIINQIKKNLKEVHLVLKACDDGKGNRNPEVGEKEPCTPSQAEIDRRKAEVEAKVAGNLPKQNEPKQAKESPKPPEMPKPGEGAGKGGEKGGDDKGGADQNGKSAQAKPEMAGDAEKVKKIGKVCKSKDGKKKDAKKKEFKKEECKTVGKKNAVEHKPKTGAEKVIIVGDRKNLRTAKAGYSYVADTSRLQDSEYKGATLYEIADLKVKKCSDGVGMCYVEVKQGLECFEQCFSAIKEVIYAPKDSVSI